MKKYIGTKEIMAEPMNECIAIKKGFARPNTDNHEWRSGYHVQYTNTDGSTYDSWSPKDVFERTYKIADTALDRMKELTDKLGKLSKILYSETYNNLPTSEKMLLNVQYYEAVISFNYYILASLAAEEKIVNLQSLNK